MIRAVLAGALAVLLTAGCGGQPDAHAGSAPAPAAARPAPLPEPVSAPRWTRNTYPGPGHRSHPGPWGPGQGSDRCEWVAAFGVSPVDGRFQLMGTDLARLVYTNAALDGCEFVPADVPLRYVSAVAFHPREPDTGYALFAQTASAPPDSGGWWRTRDQGRTWQRLVACGTARAQKRSLSVDPASGAIAIATQQDGVRVSLDDGRTWHTAGRAGRIWTLAHGHDGARLWVVRAQKPQNRWPNRGPDIGGPLEAMPGAGGDGQPVHPGPIWDIEPVPGRADRCYAIIGGTRLVELDASGAELRDLTPPDMRLVEQIRANPANPSHLVVTACMSFADGGFRFSRDGGATWQRHAVVDGQVPALRDFSPMNHRSADGTLPEYDGSWSDRPCVAFLPGDPDTVLTWGTNLIKGPYRSDDHGATFAPYAHGGSFKQGAQLALGSTAAVRAVALQEYGIVITRDGGLTWRGQHRGNTPSMEARRSDGVEIWASRSPGGVAFSPEDDRILVATYGRKPMQILRSEDGGDTWRDVGAGELDGGLVLFAPSQPRRVYAGGRRSDDGGRTFPATTTRLVLGVAAYDHRVLVARENGRTWFASRDGGDTWLPLPVPPPSADSDSVAVWGYSEETAIDPDPARNPLAGGRLRLLVGGEGGPWQYEAGADGVTGGTWSATDHTGIAPDPGQPRAWLRFVCFDQRPGHHRIAYAFGGSIGKGRGEMGCRQIHASSDGGRTWRWIADPVMGAALPGWIDPTCQPKVAADGTLIFHDTAGHYALAR